MWNSGWNNLFKNNKWGKYPCEELVRFIARKYYEVPCRKDIKILEYYAKETVMLRKKLKENIFFNKENKKYIDELFNDSFQVISDSSYYHNPYVNRMWPEIHTFRLSK